MKRREFMHSVGATSIALAIPEMGRATRIQEAPSFDAEYWDLAIQLAESIEALFEGEPSDVAQQFNQSILESARAVLAGAREAARSALQRAISVGADLWNEVDALAEALGLDFFPEYRRETLEWLQAALEEWQESGELPTFQVNDESVRCFFTELPAHEPCINAPVSAIRRCAVTSLVGLVAGPNGYATVFGLCMRKRLPGLVVRLAVDCVAPVAISCFSARPDGGDDV